MTSVPVQIAVLVDGLIVTAASRTGVCVNRDHISVSFNEQPELVDVTIYWVVLAGVAIGFEILGLLRPVVGVHGEVDSARSMQLHGASLCELLCHCLT